MKTRKTSEAIENLQIIKKSCDEAINGDWDKSSDGFETIKIILDSVINFLEVKSEN